MTKIQPLASSSWLLAQATAKVKTTATSIYRNGRDGRKGKGQADSSQLRVGMTNFIIPPFRKSVQVHGTLHGSPGQAGQVGRPATAKAKPTAITYR